MGKRHPVCECAALLHLVQSSRRLLAQPGGFSRADPASSEPDRLASLDVPSTTNSVADRSPDALGIPVRLTADTRSERVGGGRESNQRRSPMGSSRCRAVGVTLVASVALVLTAPLASAKAPTAVTRTVTDDFSIAPIRFVVTPTPAEVQAGRYRIQLINASIGPHVYVAVGGLPEDLTVDDFIEVLDDVEGGAPPPEGAFEAGAVFSAPGKFPHQKNFDFTVPGQYGFFCPIPTPAGTPHYKLGFVGLFDVVAP
jgi:uncharacterized cupredoxin-like copper-binding protein